MPPGPRSPSDHWLRHYAAVSRWSRWRGSQANFPFDYTDSGKADMKEAYAYSLDENGLPVPTPVIRA